MKLLDRAAVILINLSLFVVFIIAPALITASNPDYYSAEFEKNGLYERIGDDGEAERTNIRYVGGSVRNTAQFTDEQLDMLSSHIINYLFGDGESFALQMDGVILNGELTDGVSIFGDAAVSHMADVKELMQTAKWAAILLGVLLIGLIVYAVKRRRSLGKIALKYTLIFYAVLLFLIILFLVITLISYWELVSANPVWYLDALWSNVHHLLFPFQPEKYEGSFFNDTLTQILTLELFLDAMIIVFVTLAAALAAWLVSASLMRRYANKS